MPLTKCRSKVRVTQEMVEGENTVLINTDGYQLNATQQKDVRDYVQDLIAEGNKSRPRPDKIEDFFKKYGKSPSSSDLPVYVMRRIIPVFVMHDYQKEYGQFSQKVKGMWESKPADWPRHVPFVDPNNRRKPNKRILCRMFDHLIKKHVS